MKYKKVLITDPRVYVFGMKDGSEAHISFPEDGSARGGSVTGCQEALTITGDEFYDFPNCGAKVVFTTSGKAVLKRVVPAPPPDKDGLHEI